MLRDICERETDLTPADIDRLEEVERQLPLMAELTGEDVFIDCITRSGAVVVAAQTCPSTANSVYSCQITGQYAVPDREPAVFRALRLHVPVRELKAVTQENQSVRQDVVPILNREDRCIALLIREKDISDGLRQEKKFEKLARCYEEEDPSLRSENSGEESDLALREAHHRVKNDLQLVASILNLQARRVGDEAASRVLKENVTRVLSIASIHDILTKAGTGVSSVDSMALLGQLCQNLRAFVPVDQQIQITLNGTSAPLPGSMAGAVAIVVNELVTNAIEHAFPGRQQGTIQVSFEAGSLAHTVTVTDDGCGFDPESRSRTSLGLRIAEATVRDRLHGQLNFRSDSSGSIAAFTFQTI